MSSEPLRTTPEAFSDMVALLEENGYFVDSWELEPAGVFNGFVVNNFEIHYEEGPE